MRRTAPFVRSQILLSFAMLLAGSMATAEVGSHSAGRIPGQPLPADDSRVVHTLIAAAESSHYLDCLRYAGHPDPYIRYLTVWCFEPRAGFNRMGYWVESFPGSIRAAINRILLDLTTDPDPWVRTLALEQLKGLLWTDTLLAQRKMLSVKDQCPYPTEELCRDLTRARALFVQHSNDPDPFARAAAIVGVGLWLHDEDTATVLRKAWRDQVWVVRDRVLTAHTRAPDPALTLDALTDECASIRVRALQQTGKKVTPSETLIRTLTDRLFEQDGQVAWEAVGALHDIGTFSVIPSLLKVKESRKHNVHFVHIIDNAITAILDRTSFSPASHLVSRLFPSTQKVKKLHAGDLLASMHSESPTERMTANLNMTCVHGANGAADAQRLLEDVDPRVRFTAAWRVGWTISPDDSLDMLIRHLGDSNPHVREKLLTTIAWNVVIRGNGMLSRWDADFLERLLEAEANPWVRKRVSERITSFKPQ